MKALMRKTAAGVSAAVLAASLAGCTVGTPETVGTIGDTTISSGLYLLMQYEAYQEAGELTDDEDVLNATLTLEDGTEESAADFISRTTQESLDTYAATEAKFAELGGELSEDDLSTVESQVSSMMDSNADTLAANGIGEESVRAYVTSAVKTADLYELMYGTDGPEAVSDADVTAYINENFSLGTYIVLPNYDYSTYTALDEDTTNKILDIADEMKAALEAGDDAATVAETYLPDAFTAANYSATDVDYSNYVSTALVMPANYSSYGEEAAAAMVATKAGEVMVYQDTYSIMVYQAQDLLATYDLDTLRGTALSQMMEDTLQDEMLAEGEAMTHNLNSGTMNKLSAKNIQ